MRKLFDLFKKETSKASETSFDVDLPRQRTIPILMQDGTVEEYPDTFMITDGINCVYCTGDMYHTHFDCEFFRDELSWNHQAKGMYIRDAERKGIYQCYECKRITEVMEEF